MVPLLPHPPLDLFAELLRKGRDQPAANYGTYRQLYYERIEDELSVMYITEEFGGTFIFLGMFWEDDVPCAPEPIDNIHKMPS